MTTPGTGLDPRMNQAPTDTDVRELLPQGFYQFLMRLHEKFTPRQKELVGERHERLEASLNGEKPQHFTTVEAASEWEIDLPEWCSDQRNQMTGPADDEELVVKMLNSGAPGVMIDLEDSMANTWENLERGIANSLDALHGTLTYFNKKTEAEVPIKDSETVCWVRVRGLHLSQAGILSGELISASVFDVALIAHGIDPERLKHNLCFYIPKSESAKEALFWRDLFQEIEEMMGWEMGYIKCMALVESHPLAYQTEQFIYNLKDHILGLNLGRWDYMASLIHFNLDDPEWVLPDRNTIPTDVPFFQKLRELMVDVCHKHGLLAIGGMTALYPSRVDPELNERALANLEADKANEASVGMDGAWTGHPDQNQIAVDQFPVPNQNFKRFEGIEREPDLRPLPTGVGKHTLEGTRAAVRTVIRYRNGVLSGKGASLLDGYMEDLATDRIYRLMIAQRIRHRDAVQILDENGAAVLHTPEFISQVFDEEMERLLGELPEGTDETLKARLKKARFISEEMITKGQFDPV